MKPKVLVINTPHSDNLRILLKILKLRGNTGILLASTTDQWKLIQDYYGY